MQRDSVRTSVEGEELSSRMVTEDVTRELLCFGTALKVTLLVLGALFTAGLVAFLIRATDGFGDQQRGEWGYYAAMFAFLLATAGSAPLVAVALRFTRNHWRRPLSRASEMFAVVGVFSLLWFLPLLALLPSLEGRRSIWIGIGYVGVPLWWDFFAVLALVLCGLAILFVSALPDMAIVSRHDTGFRGRLLGRVSGFWRGTAGQWRVQGAALALLGACYFLFLIFLHSLIVIEFAMSLVPGWKDAILPPQHALTGLQAAIGSTLVALFLLRTFGGYKKYIGMEPFWAISKILLGLCLLWGYFWFANLITFWYGRQPIELTVMKTFMFESYRVPFLLNFFFSFLVPFVLLIWNPVRKSVLGPTIAGASVVLGAFFMMVRLYVPAFSIEDVTAKVLEKPPLPVTPDATDVLIIIGGIAGAVMLYLLATKLIPVMSIWETKEGLLYQRVRPFLRSRYLVLGKPD